MKKIIVLGSTGSIGKNVLEVVAHFDGQYKITGLTASENIELLEKQARRYKPQAVAILNESKAEVLKKKLKGTGVKVLGGFSGILEIAGMPGDLVFSAIVGAAGLLPTLTAIRTGKDIALANKEPMVMAGEIFKKEIKKYGVKLLPVDSEHCAIFQCLQGHPVSSVRRLLLTASGGPFLFASKAKLRKVSVSESLAHPTWKMGRKITLDSATLMNKGLEVIEAYFLFGIALEKIEVVVHPQSIIHSMVEYVDGVTLAQLSYPDMKIPIQYALTYPKRCVSKLASLDFIKLQRLDFFAPDKERFRCLHYAYEAAKKGKTFPAVLNAANEIAGAAFLDGKLGFLQIAELIGKVLKKHRFAPGEMNLKQVITADEWARKETAALIAG